MKKHLILAAMAMTALFSACNNEDDKLTNENEGKKVTFVIGGVDSRTVTTGSLGQYTTQFKTNDEVGIYATNVQSTVANSKYSVTETNSIQTLSGDEITYTEEQTPTFTAYYPYAGEGSVTTEASGAVTMTVGDQSTGIDAYDLMTAEGVLGDEGTTVSFNFAHQLAMIEVQVVGSMSSSVTSMTLNNIMPTVTWTAASNTIGAASGTATDINMYKLPNITENVYVALVPAQTIVANTRIFTTLIENKGYTFTTNNEINLTANKIKRYKITLDEQLTIEEITELGLNVLGWTTDNETADETLINKEVDDNVSAIISEYDFINARLAEETFNGYKNVTKGKWAKIINTGDYSNVTLSNGTLVLGNKTTSDNWYNTGLAYHTETISNPGTYRLTFYLKTEKDINNNYQGSGLTIAVYKYNGTEATELTTLKKYPSARDEQWILDYDLSELTGEESIIIGFGIKEKTDLTQYTITSLTLIKKE